MQVNDPMENNIAERRFAKIATGPLGLTSVIQRMHRDYSQRFRIIRIGLRLQCTLKCSRTIENAPRRCIFESPRPRTLRACTLHSST